MTRGKCRAAPAAPSGSAPAKRLAKRNAKSKSAALKAKREKSVLSSTLALQGNQHPSQLERVPLSSDLESKQTSTSLEDVAAIVSNAFIEGIKASGIMYSFQSQGQNSDLAASVQGLVADVIQDIAGESDIPNADSDSQIVTNKLPKERIEHGVRPALIHRQIVGPLASRIPDKIQSKIWAHKYIDLGVLLNTTLPSDCRYSFVMQSSQSTSRPVISEPAQKTKRIASIDQWITAFQTFVAVYTVRFSNEAPDLMNIARQYGI